jgi:arabinoxylan arabinofuranohydrolase
MDESPTGCWTNHHSIIQFKDQWYLFYHHNDYSPTFDKARSIRADSLFFNTDGTIQKVLPTYRGIGVTNAHTQIQIDRYSQISDKGASITFLDTANKFQGWKTVLEATGAWVQYNSVDFGKKNLKSVMVRALSQAGGTLQIRVQGINGPVLAEIPVTGGNDWQVVKTSLLQFKPGMQNLFVIAKENNRIEIDWTSFE